MNTLAAISLLNAALRAAQELSVLLEKAQMENRDITDDEVKAFALNNDLVSAALIDKLRA